MELSTPWDQLQNSLREKKLTLGMAESCTGGLMSATLTQNAGVSDFFLGSVVSYANSIKENILHVPKQILQSQGAVSSVTAQHMAQGARKALGCDVAVAITGIAGPGGGTAEKPVGTVCFSVCGPNFDKQTQHRFYGTRIEIQRQAVHEAVKLLIEQLDQK